MDDPILVAGRLHPDLFCAEDTPIMEPFAGRCYRVRVQVLMPQEMEVLVLEDSAPAACERAQRFVSAQLQPQAYAAQAVPFERLRPDQQCLLRQYRATHEAADIDHPVYCDACGVAIDARPPTETDGDRRGLVLALRPGHGWELMRWGGAAALRMRWMPLPPIPEGAS